MKTKVLPFMIHLSKWRMVMLGFARMSSGLRVWRLRVWGTSQLLTWRWTCLYSYLCLSSLYWTSHMIALNVLAKILSAYTLSFSSNGSKKSTERSLQSTDQESRKSIDAVSKTSWSIGARYSAMLYWLITVWAVLPLKGKNYTILWRHTNNLIMSKA